jgi:hypothetical protein
VLQTPHIVKFLFPNVPGQVSPLAFGMAPAREAEKAGGMTKVPKAWGFGSIALLEPVK